MHTNGWVEQDLGNPDGLLFYDARQAVISSSGGTVAVNRIAAGNWSINAGNSATGFVAFDLLGGPMKRVGFSTEAYYQGFPNKVGGTQAGPAGFPGAPGWPTGYKSGGIVPRTVGIPKGIQFNSLNVIYLASSADLTTFTCELDEVTYKNGAAVSITNIIASGANGLVKTHATTYYVVSVAIPTASQIYIISPLTALWFELSLVTASGGTLDIIGVEASVTYNWN